MKQLKLYIVILTSNQFLQKSRFDIWHNIQIPNVIVMFGQVLQDMSTTLSKLFGIHFNSICPNLENVITKSLESKLNYQYRLNLPIYVHAFL